MISLLSSGGEPNDRMHDEVWGFPEIEPLCHADEA